mgnify:CR=1 FL=1
MKILAFLSFIFLLIFNGEQFVTMLQIVLPHALLVNQHTENIFKI